MPMAAASPKELHRGESGASGEERQERERVDAEVRQFSDRELLDNAQRIQRTVNSGMFKCNRLPDSGKKIRGRLDAIHREQDRRQAKHGASRTPGSDRRASIAIRSRGAEPFGRLLEEDLDSTNKEANAAVKTRVNESPMEIDQLQSIINGHEARPAEPKEADRKKMAELEAEVKRLQSTIANLNAHIAESSKAEMEKTTKLEAEVKRLQSTIANLNAHIAESSKAEMEKTTNLEAEVSRHRSGVQNLRRRLKEEWERANEAETKASRLRYENYVLEEEKYSYLAPGP